MGVLDRVLDRDDVHLAVLVDPVDHRGERGGLARPGRAGHDHHAADRLHDGVKRFLRQAELLEGEDAARDEAHADPDAPAVAEDVGAEARLVAEGIGEVGAPLLLQQLLVARRRDLLHQMFGLVGGERGGIENFEAAVTADHRRRERPDVDVLGIARNDNLQDFIDIHQSSLPFHRSTRVKQSGRGPRLLKMMPGGNAKKKRAWPSPGWRIQTPARGRL